MSFTGGWRLRPQGTGKNNQDESYAYWVIGSVFHNDFCEQSWRLPSRSGSICPPVAAESGPLTSEPIASWKERGIRRSHLVLLDLIQECPIADLE